MSNIEIVEAKKFLMIIQSDVAIPEEHNNKIYQEIRKVFNEDQVGLLFLGKNTNITIIKNPA